MRPHPPPALPSSPSQRKIPLGRARPPARLGWAVWHDAQCRGGGGQARRADCVAPPAEARRRLAPDRSGQSPGARLQPPAPATPRLELGTQGHVGFVGPRGTRGTPRPRQRLHHPPAGSAGVWGCAPPPPKGLPALPTRLPPTSYRPRAWRAYACTPTCVRCTHARRLSWVRTRVHSVQPCPQVRARVCAHTHPLIFSARRL